MSDIYPFALISLCCCWQWWGFRSFTTIIVVADEKGNSHSWPLGLTEHYRVVSQRRFSLVLHPLLALLYIS